MGCDLEERGGVGWGGTNFKIKISVNRKKDPHLGLLFLPEVLKYYSNQPLVTKLKIMICKKYKCSIHTLIIKTLCTQC